MDPLTTASNASGFHTVYTTAPVFVSGGQKYEFAEAQSLLLKGQENCIEFVSSCLAFFDVLNYGCETVQGWMGCGT